MKIMYGFDEKIRCITEVDLAGPSDEGLCLAYKTTTRFLGAGLSVRDDGYVLAVVPEDGSSIVSYLGNSEEVISDYQAQNLLPSPLPEYSLPITDYLWGYSLWIILLFACVWVFYPRHQPHHGEGAEGANPENVPGV